jgi:hypothetical protein
MGCAIDSATGFSICNFKAVYSIFCSQEPHEDIMMTCCFISASSLNELGDREEDSEKIEG